MLQKLFGWMGWPGAMLVVLVAIGLLGSAGTVFIGAPFAAIPIFDLFALLLAPFPTLVCYAGVALLAFLVLRPTLALLVRKCLVVQWTAWILAVVATAIVGIAIPRSWNAAAGLKVTAIQNRPPAISLPRGGAIALVEWGSPDNVRCQVLCLSLLLQGQAREVDVVATEHEPPPLAVLPGKRFTLKPNTRNCLEGMRDYTRLPMSKSPERHNDFISRDFVPVEYGECLESLQVPIDTAQQVTLVDWRRPDLSEDAHRPGFFGATSLMRTVTPAAGRPSVVHEARYRAGWRYDVPLFISPYDGNAGSGTYFSPSISISYFREQGFPDVLSRRHWHLLENSESIGKATAAWLDMVVAPGTFSGRHRVVSNFP